MSYFIFNGHDSRDFGILSGLPVIPRAETGLINQEIPGRSEPLFRINQQYKSITLTFVLSITDPLKAREVNRAFSGSGKLILSSDTDKYYLAYANTATTPERISRRFGQITINFTCSPFAYSISEIPITYSNLISNVNSLETNQKTITLTNNGSIYSEPLYKISFNGQLSVGVGGTIMIIESPGEYTDGYVVKDGSTYYKYETEPMTIYIDTHARLAYQIENGIKKVVCDKTKGQYPWLSPGDNNISFTFSRETGIWTHNIESDGHTFTRTYYYSDQNLNEVTITKNERWL